MAAITLLLLVACVWGHVSAYRGPFVSGNYGIVGGTPVNITEVPFMALYRPSGMIWGCGASIINERFVLTAGHCCWFIPKPYVTVGTDHVLKGENFEVQERFMHPMYDGYAMDYDICLVKLKTKLKFSDRVQPIKLANKLELKEGDVFTSIGFGDTDPQFSDKSKILLKVDLPFVNHTKCQKIEHIHQDLTDNMICAGGQANKGVCKDDSGGPLFRKSDGLQYGIVSWSWGCGEAGYPDVFSSIPPMMDFVLKILKNNAD